MSTDLQRLAAEMSFYETHKGEWLRSHRDQFVVIKGATLLGFFPDFQAGYLAAVAEFGVTTDFLVKRIAKQEPVFVVF